MCIPWVGVPLPDTKEYNTIKFGFSSPANISVVGSFLLNTMISPAVIDLAVEIPKPLLDQKDDQNYRYILKRAFYLAKIADILKELPILQGSSFGWTSFRGHILKPILIIRLERAQLEIQVQISLPKEVFNNCRLGPGNNLVKKEAFLSCSDLVCSTETVNMENIRDHPTPIYNSLIQSDMLLVDHLRMIHTECKRIPNLKEAIKLGKAWLHQRRFEACNFHFSGYQFSMLCVYLAQGNQISPEMTEMQIFQAVMSLLSEINWSKPMFIGGRAESRIPDTLFSSTFAACLIEPILGMNVLFDWTADVAKEVSSTAKQTNNRLCKGDPNLTTLFLQADQKLDRFDSYQMVDGFIWMPDLEANFSHYQSQFVPEIARIKLIAKKLSFGLNTRCSGVFVHSYVSKKHSLQVYPVKATKFGIGLLLNRDQASSLVELGPIAGQTEAVKQFRWFWRERSELRRFQDGSIREAVAWDNFKLHRHRICSDIVNFVMEVHFDAKKVVATDAKLDFAWIPNSSFGAIQDAQQLLIKNIRAITDLPLSVSKCEPISPSGRMTTMTPPEPIEDSDLTPSKGSISQCRPAVNMLIHLEESSRWPHEYYGLLYAKQAFAVQICRHLIDQFGHQCSITDSFFDVLVNGYVFRCYIAHEDESRLMRFNGMDPSSIEERHVHAPRHSRAILTLVQGNSIFAPTCRLFKKWIHSQMYSRQLPDELVELISAAVFLDLEPPNSVVAGFSRILKLLIHHPWSKRPLMVNFDDSEPSSLERLYPTPFGTIVLPVCPSYQNDHSICIWSNRATITQSDLSSLQQLAVMTLNLLEDGDEADAIRTAFQSDKKRYQASFEISLKASKPVATLINAMTGDAPFLRLLPGFDAVARLLDDIEVRLPGITLYRGDEFVGINIASDLDMASVMSEIRILGGDLIHNLEW